MIGFFVPIVEALLVGYLAAVAVYMGLLFVITRLSRGLLLKDNRPTLVYTVLHAAAWCLTASAGTYLCCSLAPLGPYGLVGFPACLAIALVFILVRSFRQLPGQMSAGALALNLLAIVSGTMAALHAHHAIAAVRAA